MRVLPKDARAALPPLGEVLDFMRLIWAVDHQLQRTSKRMESALGVTGTQRLVVRLLGQFPGLSPGQLAEAMRVHASTMSGIIQRLERKGIVDRRADPRDGRRMFLGLSPKGRALNVAAGGTVEAAVLSVLQETSPTKMKACREVLESLTRALQILPPD